MNNGELTCSDHFKCWIIVFAMLLGGVLMFYLTSKINSKLMKDVDTEKQCSSCNCSQTSKHDVLSDFGKYYIVTKPILD